MDSTGLKSRTSRPRAGSLQEKLENIENDPKHYIAGSLAPQSPPTSSASTPPPMFYKKKSDSQSFFKDVYTMKWMRRPSSSFKILAIPLVFYVNWEILGSFGLLGAHRDNPWRHIFLLSSFQGYTPEGHPFYTKNYWDVAFVAYYIVVFSFLRQSLTIYMLKPLAQHWGIRKEGKIDRFNEQGYAVIYFTCSGSLGLWTMYHYLPTWYFKTEYFWSTYPQWEMVGTLKVYYLLQTAYWCQQFLVLVLKLEKPRSDFMELVAHHIVTLWMVIWSYIFSLTYIGNAIYLTMDWSDVFIALSKCFNYLHMEKTKTVAFAWFTCVWTYGRHYLNLHILWSVWNEYQLIPADAQDWDPFNGLWMAPWVKHQIFGAIALLQAINLFWYFLIWRILLRAIFSSNLDDERSDDEDEGEQPKEKAK